jgi:membrane-associated protease RseP (regulator of RpoE activity)
MIQSVVAKVENGWGLYWEPFATTQFGECKETIMSTRGSVLLAIGMLVLGLILGGIGGGVGGYFMGQSRVRTAFGQFNMPLPGYPPNANPANPNQPGGRFSQNSANGARVLDVEASSAAAQAGLQTGDVITAISGTPIDQNHQIADVIKAHKPGDKVDLTVTRGAQTLTLNVTLAASPSDSTAAYLGIRYAPAVQMQIPNQRRFQ